MQPETHTQLFLTKPLANNLNRCCYWLSAVKDDADVVKHDADTIVDNALIVEPELIADTLIDIATVIVIVTVIAIVILTGIVTATAIGIDITDLIHSSISLGLTVTTTLIILTTHDTISLAPTIIAAALDGAI